MYERLLDKAHQPTDGEIRGHLGEAASARLARFEGELGARYHLARELRFPFGQSYGWGYKYAHRATHLCYAFAEAGAFTVTLQLGDARVGAVEAVLDSLSPATRDLWAHRYPCGGRGGWVHLRVLTDDDLADAPRLVAAKVRPRA